MRQGNVTCVDPVLQRNLVQWGRCRILLLHQGRCSRNGDVPDAIGSDSGTFIRVPECVRYKDEIRNHLTCIPRRRQNVTTCRDLLSTNSLPRHPESGTAAAAPRHRRDDVIARPMLDSMIGVVPQSRPKSQSIPQSRHDNHSREKTSLEILLFRSAHLQNKQAITM